MRFDVVADCLVDPHRVERARVTSYVSCRGLNLRRRSVAYRKSAIVISDVLVSVVAALTETFLVATTLVDEDGFEVA